MDIMSGISTLYFRDSDSQGCPPIRLPGRFQRQYNLVRVFCFALLFFNSLLIVPISVWRHWGCVTPQILANFTKSFSSPDELDGFEELKAADKERVSKAWEAGNVADEDIPESAKKGDGGEEEEEEPKPKKKRAPPKKKVKVGEIIPSTFRTVINKGSRRMTMVRTKMTKSPRRREHLPRKLQQKRRRRRRRRFVTLSG
jgi:Poly(ADP-ribose) polymerase and DNA-Ligase Zn-finger region